MYHRMNLQKKKNKIDKKQSKIVANLAPHIEIAFDIKDISLFKQIKNTLLGGYFVIRPNGLSGRLVIKKQSTLLGLLNLINGHMRTPKIEALHRIIIWFNLNKGYNISLLSLDRTPLKNNS